VDENALCADVPASISGRIIGTKLPPGTLAHASRKTDVENITVKSNAWTR
jgi:hypothetical protein